MGRLRFLRLAAAAATLATVVGLMPSAGQPARAATAAAPALGAHYDGSGESITFRVHSSAATRMLVELYDKAAGAAEKGSLLLEKESGADGTWTATVTVAELREKYGIEGTVYYGYRAWGPNWPYDKDWEKGSEAGFVSDVDGKGNRFNPNKLLLDPYAREVSHDPLREGMTDKGVYGSGPEHRGKDSGTQAPKGIVLPETDPGDGGGTGEKPRRALKDDIVYEVHLRGLTKNDSSIPADERGTYKGAAAKAEELAELGVTAVEFLPLQEAQNDANDADPDSSADDNYWGYVTDNFFAPDRRYAADDSPGGPTREFRAMVKAYHDAGIKVIADVVYNHTGEGGPWKEGDKNTYGIHSYRGLDNPTYYSLTDDRQEPVDNTGVGGNFNTYNPVAQNLVIDSLRYWKDTLGIDGFRHDLASVLGNTCEHGCFKYSATDPKTALHRITEEMPARGAGGGEGTDWIAEPWALGEGTYQVGNFPAGWSEWNGKYRDTLRAHQNKPDRKVTPGQLATRLAGSSDLYGDDGRRPFNSVNFMVAHDGFTQRDLYACNEKKNDQAWPYGPSDGGSDDNISWDQGGGAAAQRQAARNGFAFLMMSAGTPMMTGGDEVLRSTRCNNNPYNLDNEANWLSHEFDSDQETFRTYTHRLLEFRKAHPALRPADFYTSKDTNGNGTGQLDWFTPAGAAPDEAYWNDASNQALAWRIDGTEFDDPADGLYVAYNGSSGAVDFTLPSPGEGKEWHRVTDTGAASEGAGQVAEPGSEEPVGGKGEKYKLGGRSVAVLIAK
ncbi:isoamylase [Streptomyces sp. WMMB 322]|uniref:isoamylase n=1 Tax=Streptomyces sp. WMMB 322 TaxID=1286821 RepID=UPI00082382E3|nr:isoamylase [Streptomyces sp. WMMB 322]SCK30995.1 glycogen operon protein [Streptomyces sp. WMMB 322]